MLFWMTLDGALDKFWMHSGQFIVFFVLLCVVNLEHCLGIIINELFLG